MMITAPFDAHVLNGLVFVNRKVLRASLRRICIDRDKHVLLIGGPPGTGKSYSVQLIKHIAEANPGVIAVAYIDLKGEQHARFRPEMLARRIMLQMGRSALVQAVPRLDDAASPAGWIRELCDWLTGEAESSGKTWIVVLDGFNHGDLPANTKDLVVELINRSVGSLALRTVLLSYSPDQVTTVQPAQRIDYETLAPLTRQDLYDFVASHARATNPIVAAADIDLVVDSVWAGVTSTGPERTQLLAQRIAAWVQP